METLKTIAALGYRIEGSLKDPLPFAHEEVAWAIQRLKDLASLDLTALHEMWQGKQAA